MSNSTSQEEHTRETNRDKERELEEALNAKTKELESLKADFKRMADKDMQQIQANGVYIGRLKDKIHLLNGSLREMECEHENLQNQVRIAQEGAFRSMKKDSWIPKEDSQVRSDLSRLGDKLKTWAKQYAIKEMGHLSPAEKSTIVEQLKKYCVCARDDWDTLFDKMTPVLKKRSPALFTQAILAKDIFSKIFTSPFFALPENEESPMPSARKMSHLYEVMKEGKQHLTLQI